MLPLNIPVFLSIYFLILSMMKHLFLLMMLFLSLGFSCQAQEEQILKGRVLDDETQTPLPYSNILVLHKNIGTISNEKGDFSLDITELSATDTLSFQYIGYKTKKLVLGNLDSISNITLKENLINLSEVFVFGNPLDAKTIIKKIIENKDRNYKPRITKAQSFIRWRNTSDIGEAEIDLKKNSIQELDEKSLKQAAEKLPKHNISYVDFLGDLYIPSSEDDSLKIDPIRTVSLKEDEIAELDQMEKLFDKLFKKTDEKEYWKVKSGILSQKLTIDEPVNQDSLPDVDDHLISTKYYSGSIENQLSYSTLDFKDQWEFLYKTGKYEYTLSGGTKVKGEDVYIIDFKPKSGGLFKGRVYVSINTYALIRADYEYAPGKYGTGFHLFGVGYSMNYFSGSIYFEKKEDTYCLKYFSLKTGQDFSVDRRVSLLKKRKRFFFDKTLKEIKVGLKFQVSSVASVEVLFLDNQAISHEQYANFRQKEKMKMIYIDHFHEDLWKGYPIIEPTKRMREYVKP